MGFLNCSAARNAVLIGLLPAFCQTLPGQSITATLTGVVEDQSGATVVSAAVTARNRDTGISYSTTTTDAGVYVLPSLPVGTFSLTIEAAGFKSFTRHGIDIGAGQRVRIDAQMELGAISEKVTVSSEAPLVQSEQAAIGGSFAPSQISRVPVGRDVTNVLQLLPGVQAAKAGYATGNINGSRESMTDFQVDGAAATQTTQGSMRSVVILEMVEEVVVQTANYSAEFGRGASQVLLNTRAGGNQLHGSLFHYFRNNVLNANSFMGNLYGNTKPVVRYNLFGGTWGGPVVLPKLYDGRNRTFFTFGYEGTRQRSFGQQVSTVPTAPMRAGDFAGMAAIFDPATTRPNAAGTGFLRTVFPQNRVPANRFDAAAVKMLEVAYPLPTRPGVANNYVYAGPGKTTGDGMNARVDQNFTEKSRLTTRYIHRRNISETRMRFPGPAGAGSNSSNESSGTFTHVLSAEHTYLVRPNLINTARFGFYRDDTPKEGPGTNEGWAGKLGIPNAGPEKFPLVSITSLSPFGGANLANQTPASNFQFADSLFWISGRHSVKLGGEYRRLRSYTWQPGNPSGSFTFNTLPTMDPSNQRNGIGMAGYLLGIPSTSSISLYPEEGFAMRWGYYAAFVQDDFRVSKSLALNLGLRWEVNRARKEKSNRQSNLDLASLKLKYAGQGGYPVTLYDTDWQNLQPRFGLAYTPFGSTRTVIRAGYGLFILPSNAIGDAPFTTGPWSRNLTYPSPDSGITFPMTLSGGFPVVRQNDPLVLGPNVSLTWLPRDYPNGYAQQWSLNVQRELPGRALVEAGYIGSKGNSLQLNYNLNQVPASLLGPGNAQSRRPYPTLGSITASYNPVGNSIYHALQLRFEKRYSRGYAIQSAYTFGKSIDDASGIFDFRSYGVTGVQDNFNLRAERSVSGFDLAHNFTWSFAWSLPFGKDRTWLRRGGLLNAVLGGWNLSALSSVRSGMPLAIGTVQNLTGSMGGGSRPNRLRDAPLSGSQRSIVRWFDPAGFEQPAPFAFGNTSRTEPRLREPGEFNMSALLAKEFRMSESRYFELRGEFGNVLNHFNPGTPNSTIGSPGVATITGGDGGRSVLLALRLFF